MILRGVFLLPFWDLVKIVPVAVQRFGTWIGRALP